MLGSIMLDSIMPSDSLPVSSAQKEYYNESNNSNYNINLLGCIEVSIITEGFRVGIHWQHANNRCTHSKALQETLEIARASFSQVYSVCIKHVYECTFTAVNDRLIYCVDAVNTEKRMWTYMHPGLPTVTTYTLSVLFFLYSSSLMVHTAPWFLFNSTLTKHLCSDKLCLMAFYIINKHWEK